MAFIIVRSVHLGIYKIEENYGSIRETQKQRFDRNLSACSILPNAERGFLSYVKNS